MANSKEQHFMPKMEPRTAGVLLKAVPNQKLHLGGMMKIAEAGGMIVLIAILPVLQKHFKMKFTLLNSGTASLAGRKQRRLSLATMFLFILWLMNPASIRIGFKVLMKPLLRRTSVQSMCPLRFAASGGMLTR